MNRLHLVAMAFTVLAFLGCGEQQSERASSSSQPVTDEPAKEERLLSVYEEANRDLTKLLEVAKAEARGDLESWEEASLRKLGLAHPMSDLRKSLAKQTQLLPPKSDKGLAFYFEAETARFLDPHQYVWVTFTEGHYGGEMLLRYEVSNGSITWAKLWSAMD